MAEIKIEKKKPIWPWILAALAVILVLWLIFSGSDDDEIEPVVTETEIVEEEVYETEPMVTDGSTAVTNYVTFVRTNSEERMSLSHNFTETALERLARAVEARAEEANVSIEDEKERIKNAADYITKDPYVEQHADSIRVAFGAFTDAIMKINQSENTNSTADVEGLREHADALQPGQLTLNQKDAVLNYFDKAAEVLERMDEENL